MLWWLTRFFGIKAKVYEVWIIEGGRISVNGPYRDIREAKQAFDAAPIQASALIMEI